MKRYSGVKRIGSASVLGLFISAIALAANPVEQAITFSKAFVPVGFDDNDRVQVTVEGTFPDSCYRVGSSTSSVDAQKGLVTIETTALKYSGFCLPLLVPFVQVVDLGVLPKGQFQIVDAASGGARANLAVASATTNEADDYLYAPVDDATVETDATTGISELVLTGRFSDRCTRWKRTQVSYYPDVIVVQPIMESIVPPTGRAAGTCGLQKSRFQKREVLKSGLKGTMLLHVRALSGQAINKLVELN